jgi:hypothetical protein
MSAVGRSWKAMSASCRNALRFVTLRHCPMQLSGRTLRLLTAESGSQMVSVHVPSHTAYAMPMHLPCSLPHHDLLQAFAGLHRHFVRQRHNTGAQLHDCEARQTAPLGHHGKLFWSGLL